jgi:hypothetical protein
MSAASVVARSLGVATIATVLLIPATGASGAPTHQARLAAQPPGTTGGFGLVAAVPHSSDAWAGGIDESYGIVPLIGRYHDGKWSRIKINIGRYGALAGIAAGSSKVVWAVGDHEGSSAVTTPLIARWHGKSFTRVKLPSTISGAFNAISASAANNAWAVGAVLENGTKPVAEHWNGKKWSAVPVPVADSGVFEAVSTSGPKNAWAVVGQTLVHWNGKKWANAATTVPASVQLRSIATTAPKHAVAVGISTNPTTMVERLYILRLEGNTWRRVAAPHPNRQVTEASVTMHGSAAWIADTGTTPADAEQSAILHSTGGKWKVQRSSVHGDGGLSAVSAESSKRVYAVGSWRPDDDSYPQTVFSIYNGHSWKSVRSVV